MIFPDFSGVQLKLGNAEGKKMVFDPIRRKWLVLTPEEYVRQYILQYLMGSLHYPAALISVEKTILVNNLVKRFDIVVYNREHKPWMLVECKAPEVSVTEATLLQALRYNNTVGCAYWLLTNGHQTYCADACDINDIKWLSALPAYNS